MHDDVIHVTFDIDEDVLNACSVNFVLQPLVENAILHGLDERAGSGHLKISAKAMEGCARLEVKDDGAGIPARKLQALLDGESAGYGLRNVNRRIKLCFGDQYGLEIQSPPGEGTTAAITIPYDSAG